MSHLTEAHRYTISEMLTQGCTKTFIADTIGNHRSMVSCELNPNSALKNAESNKTKKKIKL